METMKIAKDMIGTLDNLSSWEIRITETRLIWIPGDRPVMVPAIQPIITASRKDKISSAILY